MSAPTTNSGMECPKCKAEFTPTAKQLAVAMGARGGKVKSPAKTEAARLNAKKGGWPKGKPRKP